MQYRVASGSSNKNVFWPIYVDGRQIMLVECKQLTKIDVDYTEQLIPREDSERTIPTGSSVGAAHTARVLSTTNPHPIHSVPNLVGHVS